MDKIFCGLPHEKLRQYILEHYDDSSKKPLTFTATEANSTVRFNNQHGTYRYKKNNDDWKDYTWNSEIILENINDTVSFSAKTTNDTCYNSLGSSASKFYFTGKIKSSGNIMSLLDKDLNTKDIPELCFSSMFKDLTSLLQSPIIKADNMSNGGCLEMFWNCSELTSINEINVKNTLSSASFRGMFKNCSKLADASKMIINNTGINTCRETFYNCSALIIPPVINATNELLESTYQDTFRNCVSLEEMPNLPALTVNYSGNDCYNGTFYGCKSLKTCNKLSICGDISKGYGSNLNRMHSMFYGCTSLSSAYIHIEYNGDNTNMYNMFANCSSLQLIDIDIISFNGFYYSKWLENAKNDNTCVFRCKSSLSSAIASLTRDDNTIPSEWQIEYK